MKIRIKDHRREGFDVTAYSEVGREIRILATSDGLTTTLLTRYKARMAVVRNEEGWIDAHESGHTQRIFIANDKEIEVLPLTGDQV